MNSAQRYCRTVLGTTEKRKEWAALPLIDEARDFCAAISVRKKEKALVVTFNTTVAAMEAEQYFQDHKLPGRIIPVPPSVKAGCGLAWMSPPDKKDEMEKELKDAGIQWHEMHVMEV